MYRVKRLYILAGVLALTCAAAVWALHQEERQEQIASSGETVLEIDPDTVRSLSWEYDGETLSSIGMDLGFTTATRHSQSVGTACRNCWRHSARSVQPLSSRSRRI